jgi:hypothetical protein
MHGFAPTAALTNAQDGFWKSAVRCDSVVLWSCPGGGRPLTTWPSTLHGCCSVVFRCVFFECVTSCGTGDRIRLSMMEGSLVFAVTSTLTLWLAQTYVTWTCTAFIVWTWPSSFSLILKSLNNGHHHTYRFGKLDVGNTWVPFFT